MEGIEPHGPPGPTLALVWFAEVDRQRRAQCQHMGVERFEFIRTLMVLLRLGEPPSIHHDLAEDEVAPTFRRVDRQGLLCRPKHFVWIV